MCSPLLALWFAACASTACGRNEPVDPTGNWELTITPDGDCGGGISTHIVTVTETDDLYRLSAGVALIYENVVTDALFSCNLNECTLSGTESVGVTTAEPSETTGGFFLVGNASYNLVLDSNGTITGTGSERDEFYELSNVAGVEPELFVTCSYVLDVDGTKS